MLQHKQNIRTKYEHTNKQKQKTCLTSPPHPQQYPITFLRNTVVEYAWRSIFQTVYAQTHSVLLNKNSVCLAIKAKITVQSCLLMDYSKGCGITVFSGHTGVLIM